jgi:hypothetical protein
MTTGSFGPVNSAHPKHGECLYCFDENHGRDKHLFFGQRPRMVGQVCGHRLRKPKRTLPQFVMNRNRASRRLRPVGKG